MVPLPRTLGASQVRYSEQWRPGNLQTPPVRILAPAVQTIRQRSPLDLSPSFVVSRNDHTIRLSTLERELVHPTHNQQQLRVDMLSWFGGECCNPADHNHEDTPYSSNSNMSYSFAQDLSESAGPLTSYREMYKRPGVIPKLSPRAGLDTARDAVTPSSRRAAKRRSHAKSMIPAIKSLFTPAGGKGDVPAMPAHSMASPPPQIPREGARIPMEIPMLLQGSSPKRYVGDRRQRWSVNLSSDLASPPAVCPTPPRLYPSPPAVTSTVQETCQIPRMRLKQHLNSSVDHPSGRAGSTQRNFRSELWTGASPYTKPLHSFLAGRRQSAHPIVVGSYPQVMKENDDHPACRLDANKLPLSVSPVERLLLDIHAPSHTVNRLISHTGSAGNPPTSKPLSLRGTPLQDGQTWVENRYPVPSGSRFCPVSYVPGPPVSSPLPTSKEHLSSNPTAAVGDVTVASSPVNIWVSGSLPVIDLPEEAPSLQGSVTASPRRANRVLFREVMESPQRTEACPPQKAEMVSTEDRWSSATDPRLQLIASSSRSSSREASAGGSLLDPESAAPSKDKSTVSIPLDYSCAGPPQETHLCVSRSRTSHPSRLPRSHSLDPRTTGIRPADKPRYRSARTDLGCLCNEKWSESKRLSWAASSGVRRTSAECRAVTEKRDRLDLTKAIKVRDAHSDVEVGICDRLISISEMDRLSVHSDSMLDMIPDAVLKKRIQDLLSQKRYLLSVIKDLRNRDEQLQKDHFKFETILRQTVATQQAKLAHIEKENERIKEILLHTISGEDSAPASLRDLYSIVHDLVAGTGEVALTARRSPIACPSLSPSLPFADSGEVNMESEDIHNYVRDTITDTCQLGSPPLCPLPSPTAPFRGGRSDTSRMESLRTSSRRSGIRGRLMPLGSRSLGRRDDDNGASSNERASIGTAWRIPTGFLNDDRMLRPKSTVEPRVDLTVLEDYSTPPGRRMVDEQLFKLLATHAIVGVQPEAGTIDDTRVASAICSKRTCRYPAALMPLTTHDQRLSTLDSSRSSEPNSPRLSTPRAVSRMVHLCLPKLETAASDDDTSLNRSSGELSSVQTQKQFSSITLHNEECRTFLIKSENGVAHLLVHKGNGVPEEVLVAENLFKELVGEDQLGDYVNNHLMGFEDGLMNIDGSCPLQDKEARDATSDGVDQLPIEDTRTTAGGTMKNEGCRGEGKEWRWRPAKEMCVADFKTLLSSESNDNSSLGLSPSQCAGGCRRLSAPERSGTYSARLSAA